MAHTYPNYSELDITQYDTLFGYYTLGFIQHHCPDFYIIDIRLVKGTWDQQHELDNYDWLEPRIREGLDQGKKVVIVAEDEHVVFSANRQLAEILNRYVSDPVYWTTMIDSNSQYIFRNYHGIKCKIVELPRLLLNECLAYYRVANTANNYNNENNYNFVYLMGNVINAKFKIETARVLRQHQLDNFGLITISANQYSYPEDLFEFCQVNQHYPYTVSDPRYSPCARQTCVNNVWISKNVENFLHIDQEYHNIPLAINPETTTGPFKSTEKSIWPILLGKLFLLYGRPGTMAWIQQFYDIDISRFANIEYDTIIDDNVRLETMISSNQHLIRNAKDIYQELQPELEAARWTLGKNMYNFFISQLEIIV